MAAIYGLPTSQSPLPSPDRAHPMRRLSSTTHTPSASPPMPHSALSRVSPDQGLPPNKRARLSAATWPSTLNIDTLAANNISPTSMAAPRSAIDTSAEGRTAATAISVDDDTQASSSGDETEPSAREGATEDHDGNAQKPVVSTPVTTPVMQRPPGHESPVDKGTTESTKMPETHKIPALDASLVPPPTRPQKRVLPDRQARRSSQLISSKTLVVEEKDNGSYKKGLEKEHTLPPAKTSTNNTGGRGSRKRKLSPLSQEANVSDSDEENGKDTTKSSNFQNKPGSEETTQALSPITSSPDLTEPYVLQYGPPTASARALYELFTRICTWSYKTSTSKCALCM